MIGYPRHLVLILASLGALLILTVGTAQATGTPPTATATPHLNATPAATRSPTPTPDVSPSATPDVSPTPSLAATATSTATSTRTPTPTRATPLTKFAGLKAVRVEGDDDSLVLDVPLRSQYDLSPYQNANCGPASLAMVLQAYGLSVPTERIRALSNQFQGTYDYDEGIALDYLVAIGQQAGLRQEGLYGPDRQYRQWTIDDVVREVRAGYPVITLVHYNSLPQHQRETSPSDHYVVVVGVTSQGFLINDPASVGKAGYRQLLTPAELIAAWKAASRHQQAAAFLPPTGKLALNPANGEANDGPSAAFTLTAGPAATNRALSATPQPSPTVPTATPLPTDTPPPTVNPTLLSEADALKNWTRPTEVSTRLPATSTPEPRLTAFAEATSGQSSPASPLPSLVVLAAVGAGMVGVIKSTSR